MQFFTRIQYIEGAKALWRYRLFVALVSVVCVFGAEFALLTLPKANAAYTVANSARFVAANSDSLTRSVTASNRKTFTISFWFKRGTLNTLQYLINGSSTQGGGIGLDQASGGFCSAVGDQMLVAFNGSVVLCTSAVFRDSAAWTHVVLAVDTTQAVAANRVKLYVNGAQVTAFSTASYPAQNTDLNWNNTDTASIGRLFAATYFFDGNMADIYNIDGAALAPTCFGATDGNGYWRPITYSTASPCAAYGTNGFHLLFGNGASLGTDSAGSNNWTVNGLVAADQVIDSPTNSYATLSPVDKEPNATLTSGNLKLAAAIDTGGLYRTARSTIAPASGKWYAEATLNVPSTGAISFGVGAMTDAITSGGNYIAGSTAKSYGLYYNSVNQYIANNSSPIQVAAGAPTTNSVWQVALDMNNGKVWFGKNNTWYDSAGGTTGNPATGANPSFTISPSSLGAVGFVGGSNTATNGSTLLLNFGQGGTTTVAYDSASGGYFYYTPPSGFKALSTANLTAPTIAVPKNYFDATPYTGTGSTLTVMGSTTVVSFTSTGTTTWQVPTGVTSVEVLVVGGGGGGGARGGGGGGAGGYQVNSAYTVTPGSSITLAVGAGGAGGVLGVSNAGNGVSSAFGTLISQGGGGGANFGSAGIVGASGGGGSFGSGGGSGIAGQGYAGGNSSAGSSYGGAGGGGAGAAGSANSGTTPGNGGTGIANSITGASVTYAGGGGGGGELACSSASAGGGGAGHCDNPGTTGGAGTNGLGGGGGGGSAFSSANGGAGGSGIVIIKYTPALAFQPDLVWIKDRTSANAHGIFDSARTATKYWSSNANTAETTDAQSLTAFSTNGFSLGTQALFNTSGNSYVAWVWKKCPAISGLTCTAADGVDIVTYSGDNTANRNISHSLGAAPDMVIVKRRDSAGDPYMWHSGLTGATYFTLLDSTAAQSSTNSPWGTGNFSSTQFMVTNDATNNLNYNNTGVCGAAGFTNSGGVCTGFLTSGTSWTVPSDWNSSNNTIEVIGGGGGGGSDYTARVGGGGGGGGGYTKATNVTLTTGASVAYAVGAAGTGGASGGANNGTGGGDTYFCNSTSNCASISGTAVKVGAKGGSGGVAQSSTNAGGGAASSAVGGAGGGTANPGAPYAYTGGQGGGGSTGSASLGGGGGGAGGPGGAGGAGANDTATGTANNGGNGGGGGGGGTAGTTATPGASIGGVGGNGNSGATGGAGGTSGTHAGGVGGSATGSSGGGGGGGWGSNVSTDGDGGNGGIGKDWDATHGSGGGGASHGYYGGQPGNGGLYGGGGSGGSDYYLNTTPAGGNGAQGLIAITYTPSVNVGTYVAYLFKSIDGFSKFGTYTGNAAADGPFIYTGFKPRYILLKNIGTSVNWLVIDTATSPINLAANVNVPNLNSAESGGNTMDILSNGFKIRGTGTGYNGSGNTLVYAAFAEQPFKYSAASAAPVASSFVQAIALLIGMVF